MKTRNIFSSLLLLAVASVMALVSCTKQETGEDGSVNDKPSFPALVENYNVAPGSELAITFTPNYDWKISVPSDLKQWFWIIDDTFRLSDIYGRKSSEPVTVKIGVTKNAEFDKSFSCEVTMTMNGQSVVVAKYMLPAKERTIAVYAAMRDENGAFMRTDDGKSYVYSDAPASALDLSWSDSDADFRMPLKVSSNFHWSVDMPAWADVDLPENRQGQVEVVLTGVSLDAAEGDLIFKDASGNAQKQLKMSIPSAKEVNVYSAIVSEGELEYGEGGDYAWTSEPVSTVSLAWLGSDFRMPVRIESKCNWTLDVPEWLSAEIITDEDDDSGKTAGVRTVILKGVPSKYPLEETSDEVTVKFGDSAIHEFEVTIPGCKDIMSWSVNMGLTELDFNASGQLKTAIGYEDVPVSGTVLGTSSVEVFAVERVDGKFHVSGEEDPSWINIELGAYNTSNTAPVLQPRSLTVTVDENPGDERSAVIVFAPYNFWGKLSNLFTEDMTQVKEEYAGNCIEVRQLSSDVEYIMMSSSEEEMESVGARFAPADEAKAASLCAQFGQTSYVYTLSYEYTYSRDNAWMTLARPYTEVRYYDSTFENIPSDTVFWLSYLAGNDDGTYGQMLMYKAAENPADNEDNPYSKLPEEPSTGYVVFYDSNGNVLAVVECISPKAPEVVTPPGGGDTPAEDVKEDISREFIIGATAAINKGAKLERITAGPTYNAELESIGNANAEVWLLTLPDYDSAVNIRLKGKQSKYYQMPYALRSYISVNGKYVEGSEILSTAIQVAEIKMSKIPDDLVEDYTPHVRFHDSRDATYAFLVVYLTVKQ